MAAKIPIGGNSINKDVPILNFKDPSIPNKDKRGTINISAPAPSSPATSPLNNLFFETAKNIKLGEKNIAFVYKTYFKGVINNRFYYS